jgi:very-short-patch-repair endonuclease
VRYNFGPINQNGGQRRLNVAITRARRRMTVVSCFSGKELDPERLSSTGPVMLRDYLLYAESGGSNLGLRARRKPELNPFERDVMAKLEAAGLRVVPQFGASGYWIDFAVMHPEAPSQPLLAVEADGAMYHSQPTARDRDRLRQQHLERLGWRFQRIWSVDWFREPEREMQRVLDAYDRALRGDEEQAEAFFHGEPAELAASEPAGARGKFPAVRRGYSITEYSMPQLRAVVRWVKSDGRLYTRNELLGETMKALGFHTRGSRIVAAIEEAILREETSP